MIRDSHDLEDVKVGEVIAPLNDYCLQWDEVRPLYSLYPSRAMLTISVGLLATFTIGAVSNGPHSRTRWQAND